MSLINKEKAMNGFGKAIDATNNVADKVETFVKEKELDKKAKDLAEDIGEGMKTVGKTIEETVNKVLH
ncbi:MAG: hypothetical protein ACI4E1_07110 [Lachnospira sp.]